MGSSLLDKKPSNPRNNIHSTDTGNLVRVYEENAKMVQLVQQYDLPTVDYMSFPVTNSDQKVKMIHSGFFIRNF